jgi:hypothetical protein
MYNLSTAGSAWGPQHRGKVTASRAIQQQIIEERSRKAAMMPGFSGPGAYEIGTTTVDDTLQQKVYTDIVSGAILTSSPLLMFGSGVVMANFNARFAPGEEGTTVSVPYFDPIGPMQTLEPDGKPGVPYKITSHDEQNTIKHGYIGMAATEMAELFSPFGAQMRDEFQAQARVRNAEWADTLLVTEAVTKAVAAGDAAARAKRFLTKYVASGPPYKFRRQLWIDALHARGALGFTSMPALLVVHVDVLADMMSVNDAVGNMNLVKAADVASMRDVAAKTTEASPTGLMLDPFNIPIAVSSLDVFKPAVGAGELPKYRSLILWPRALGWRQTPRPILQATTNIHVPVNEMAMHTYAVAHAYKRADMVDLPGVFVIEHN